MRYFSKWLAPFALLLFLSTITVAGLSSCSKDETICTNTCSFARDGDCDDGGPGSDFSLCDLGTDCADCGSR